jgi:hypothetical protein
MIIDCHGHYTTAPAAHTAWREAQRAAFEANQTPPPYPTISDDEIRETVETSQLRLMAERGIDLTIFSPRASAMGHHIGPQLVPALRGDGRARRAGDGHVSAVTNKNFHATGSHYLNADTTAFMQLLQADLFTDFPQLRLVIPHGGGAVPYHWGRFRGLADMLDRPAPEDALMRNVFFDTCVYHQPGINLLFDVIGIDSILFGSEMVGAVRGIDPQTGHHFDDTRRYVEALPLAPGDRTKVFETNSCRVYPRLHAALTARTVPAEVG